MKKWRKDEGDDFIFWRPNKYSWKQWNLELLKMLWKKVRPTKTKGNLVKEFFDWFAHIFGHFQWAPSKQ